MNLQNMNQHKQGKNSKVYWNEVRLLNKWKVNVNLPLTTLKSTTRVLIN